MDSQVYSSLSSRFHHLTTLITSSTPLPLPTPETHHKNSILTSFSRIKSTLFRLQQELQEANLTRIETDKKWEKAALNWENERISMENEYKKEMERREKEWEMKLEAQVKFSEELLEDKEGKIKEIQELRKKLTDLESKMTRKIEKLKEKSVKEMKKAKELWQNEANIR